MSLEPIRVQYIILVYLIEHGHTSHLDLVEHVLDEARKDSRDGQAYLTQPAKRTIKYMIGRGLVVGSEALGYRIARW